MVLCPVALAIGCRKCPVFAVCPLKSTIGDYTPERGPERAPAPRAAAQSEAVAKTVKKAAKKAVKATTRGGESRRRSSKRRP
jgi:hypothetical protein